MGIRIYRHFISLSLVISMFSCTQNGSNAPFQLARRIKVGKSSASELFAELGHPVRSYQPEERPQAEVHQFSGSENESYQVENEKVVAHFRDPTPDEQTLQYWRHLWRGRGATYTEIPGTRNPHGQALYTLRDQSNHMAIIYDQAKGRVVRVMQYGE